MVFLLDIGGTLENNPVLSRDQVEGALALLKSRGAVLHVWSGCIERTPEWIRSLAHALYSKADGMPIREGIVVDDEEYLLRTYGRFPKINTMTAEAFGAAMLQLLEAEDARETAV